MSENIQSISQGTFTIGQTSATNFIAGNGITIDSPSAGTVRIGNDETVLYNYPSSENAYENSRKLISFSESCRNFERIRVYLINDDNVMRSVDVVPGSEDHKETFEVDMISNEPKLYVKITTWLLGSSSLTYVAGCYYYINNGGSGLNGTTVNKTINYVVPYKIVGINRIAGGSNE